MSDHIQDDLLIDYADDPRSHPELDRHLGDCGDCRNALSFYRALNAELSQEEIWSAEEEIRLKGGQRAVREFAERIATEDSEAHRLLGGLLDSPYRFARASITLRKRFRAGGVVRLLCGAVRRECKHEPTYAIELARAAQIIADALPDDYYPSRLVFDLRGTSWKEYAVACQHLALYDAGLDAIKHAERAYLELPDPGAGMAAVNVARAILLWKLHRYLEALPCARAAAREYETPRDPLRFTQAREVEAVILERMGDYRDAREIYRDAFEAADVLEDLDMKARAARNLGINYRDSGDLGRAGEYFLLALQLYEGLEQPASVARTRWSIARLSLMAGDFVEATRRLRPVIADLTAKGLANDVADAKLDLAEALLMLGVFDEVQLLCADVAQFFREAGLVTGALTAATFLREAASTRSLKRGDIEHVRTYLAVVREDPELVFAAPPDAP